MDGVFAGISDPRLVQLYHYWRVKKAGRRMPSPADINSAMLPRTVQPNTMLLEIVREGDLVRFRYTKVGQVFWRSSGLEPTGRFVDEVLPATAGYRDYVVGIYQEMTVHARPMYTENLFILHHGQSDPMATRRVSLPLSRDGSKVDEILAAHVFDYGTGNADAFSLVSRIEEGARVFLE